MNEVAQAVIRSMRELTDRMDFFGALAQNELLESRNPGEAYCRASIGKEYALYFPDGGTVEIDLSGLNGKPTLVWLDVLKSEWSEEEILAKKTIRIIAPSEGHWIALIR